MTEKFQVIHYFDDHDYVKEGEPLEVADAMDLAISFTTRPTAILGMTKRVIVVDMLDRLCFDWRHGEGVVFPTEEDIIAEREKREADHRP